MAKVIGKVAQIMGPVIDVSFSTENELPLRCLWVERYTEDYLT